MTVEEKIEILEKENQRLRQQLENKMGGYVVDKAVFDKLREDYQEVTNELKIYRDKYHTLVEDMEKIKEIYTEQMKNLIDGLGKGN